MPLLVIPTRFVPGNPFVRPRLFDVEQPLAAQGIAADRYDIAIATNVLHATKNIRQTLRNVKAALRRRGALFLNEMLPGAVAVKVATLLPLDSRLMEPLVAVACRPPAVVTMDVPASWTTFVPVSSIAPGDGLFCTMPDAAFTVLTATVLALL